MDFDNLIAAFLDFAILVCKHLGISLGNANVSKFSDGEISLVINEKMATQSMFKLMMKQKKHTIAMQILNAMKQTVKNKKFITSEKKKIHKLLGKRKQKHVI